MKKIVAVFTAFVTGTIVAACVSVGAGSGGPVVNISTTNRASAAEHLTKFLTGRSIEAKLTGDKRESVRVAYDGGIFVLEPRLSANGLDRIIVNKYYGVKKLWVGKSEVQEMLTKINANYNVATFSLSTSGKTLIIQTHITFVNELSEKEILAFLRWMNSGVREIAQETKNFSRYID